MGGSESKEAGPKALQRARMMVDENRVMLFRYRSSTQALSPM